MKYFCIALFALFLPATTGFCQVMDTKQLLPKLILPLGHSEVIVSADFHPSKGILATASYDNTIKLWDTHSGILLADLKGPGYYGDQNVVEYVEFSPSGNLVAGLFYDDSTNFIMVWNTESINLKFTIPIPGVNFCLTFSPDGKRIAFNSGEQVSIWNTETGTKIIDLIGHKDYVIDIQFSPKGDQIVTASKDRSARIWDVITGKTTHTLRGHSNTVNNASFNANGRLVATSSEDGTARIWNVQNGKVIHKLSGHSKQVNHLAWSSDGTKVLTSSSDHSSRVFDAINGSTISTIEGSSGEPIYGQFTRDGALALTTSEDNHVILWSTTTSKIERVLREPNLSNPMPVRLSPNDSLVVILNDSRTGADIVNIYTSESKKTALSGNLNTPMEARFYDEDKLLITSSRNTVNLWDAMNLRLIRSISGYCSSLDANDSLMVIIQDEGRCSILHLNNMQTTPLDIDKSIDNGILSPDGNLFISWACDGIARIWETKTRSFIGALIGHSACIYAARFSPNNTQVVTASSDSTIRIWDVASLREIKKINTGVENLNLKFNRNGTQFLSTGYAGAVEWDLSSGKIVSSHHDGHTRVEYATYSKDESQLLASCIDKTALVYDFPSGKILKVLVDHAGAVNSICSSDDNQRIVTSSADGTFKIWSTKENMDPILTLISLDSTDYLVYDEHYRYDGSERARKMLYFTCGTEVIELDQVKDQLWVPNLAERIMRGETINSPKLSDLNLCDLLPRVEEQPAKDNTYAFHIFPRRGGLGESVLYVNGVESRRFSRSDLDKDGDHYVLSLSAADLTDHLIPGQPNSVTVKAYTAKNDISSRGVVVEVATPTKTKLDPPALHAVIVGVSDYKGDALDLKLAAKDARDFGTALRASASPLFNFDGKDRIHLYLAHTDTGRTAFPDKASIRKLFDNISTTAKPNDVLLLFFAGHGVLNKNDNQFYFLTADASSMSDPEGVGISSQELFSWMQPSRIKAQKRVLILDACQSGQAIKDLVKIGDAGQQFVAARSDEQSKYIKAIDKMNERSGLFILSAAASDQSAYEMSRYNQGILTYSLLKSLKEDGTVLENNKYLNLDRWFAAAEKIVEEIAESSGARQQPQIVRTTNFNIGVVDEEVRKKVKLANELPLFTGVTLQSDVKPWDELDLSVLVNKELMSISERGRNQLEFRPSNTSDDAIRLSGRYQVSGQSIRVNLIAVKRKKIIKEFSVSGMMDNLEKLARDIVKATIEQTKL